MTARNRTSTPLGQWPALDQRLWQKASTKGDFLDPDGKGAHWADATKTQVRKGYSKWIFHLNEDGTLPDEDEICPADRISEDRLRFYLKRLQDQGLASTTIASRITDLTEALRVMVPLADLTLLKQLCCKTNQRAEPSRKKHARIKPPSEIWDASYHYMDSIIQRDDKLTINIASRFRDAMTLGLLAHRPLRRRNISNLTLGKDLLFEKGAWHCHISGTETKDGSDIRFVLPDDPAFSTVFTHYLLFVRQRLLRGTPLDRDAIPHLTGPLWISTRGRQMTDHAIYYSVNRISEDLLGAPLNPHLLRDCAASAMSSEAPEYILAASRILGHQTLTTTISHYEQSSMLAAGARLTSALEEIQERASNTELAPSDDPPFITNYKEAIS
jgi:site-specific recombinase XerD